MSSVLATFALNVQKSGFCQEYAVDSSNVASFICTTTGNTQDDQSVFGAENTSTGLSLQEADVPDMFSDDIFDTSPAGGRRPVNYAPFIMLCSPFAL